MSTVFTKDYTPYAKKVLNKYGDYKIHHIIVCRTPINTTIALLLSAISLGKFDKMKREYGYEKFFHLYIAVFLIEPGSNRVFSIIIEKNSTITINNNEGRENIPDQDKIVIPPNVIPNGLTLRNMMDATHKIMGNNFFYYESIPSDGRQQANNCQNFVGKILEGIGLLTLDRAKFIFQPIDELAKNLPGYFKKITKHITDLGGFFDYAHSTVRSFLGFKQGGFARGKNKIRKKNFRN